MTNAIRPHAQNRTERRQPQMPRLGFGGQASGQAFCERRLNLVDGLPMTVSGPRVNRVDEHRSLLIADFIRPGARSSWSAIRFQGTATGYVAAGGRYRAGQSKYPRVRV
jgi:hypothetical protein